MLKKVKTNITYKVPAWGYCNLVARGTLSEPSSTLCRFCVKEGKGYRCALYNDALDVESGSMPIKSRECQRATAGFNSVVTDVEEADCTPDIDTKRLMKAAIDGYRRMYKKLINDGYPATLAEQLATEYMLGGK